jgi:hypothetical protein
MKLFAQNQTNVSVLKDGNANDVTLGCLLLINYIGLPFDPRRPNPISLSLKSVVTLELEYSLKGIFL